MASASVLPVLLIATLLLLSSSPAVTASAASSSSSSSSSSSDVCPCPERTFVHSIMSKCPLRTDLASAVEVLFFFISRVVLSLFIYLFCFLPMLMVLGPRRICGSAFVDRASGPTSVDGTHIKFRGFIYLCFACPWKMSSLHLVTKVTGEMVDRELGHGQDETYHSILFYASWCPFSRNFRPTFDALSSMFPQIRHLAVEQSSAMPSVLSKYGIHSFPTLLLANRTTRVQYHGGKNIICIVNFYREATGLDPVHSDVGQSTNPAHLGSQWPWSGSPREIISNEPYLVLGLLFVSLKVSTQLLVVVIAHLKAVWIFYHRALNFNLFGETRRLLEQVVRQAIDVKSLWSKIRRCHKSRNFSKRAKSARVWASSLTSVS